MSRMQRFCGSRGILKEYEVDVDSLWEQVRNLYTVTSTLKVYGYSVESEYYEHQLADFVRRAESEQSESDL